MLFLVFSSDSDESIFKITPAIQDELSRSQSRHFNLFGSFEDKNLSEDGKEDCGGGLCLSIKKGAKIEEGQGRIVPLFVCQIEAGQKYEVRPFINFVHFLFFLLKIYCFRSPPIDIPMTFVIKTTAVGQQPIPSLVLLLLVSQSVSTRDEKRIEPKRQDQTADNGKLEHHFSFALQADDQIEAIGIEVLEGRTFTVENFSILADL